VGFKIENLIYLVTVDTFSTCGLNFRMRKYAQCGPRLNVFGLLWPLGIFLALLWKAYIFMKLTPTM